MSLVLRHYKRLLFSKDKLKHKIVSESVLSYIWPLFKYKDTANP